MTRARILQPFLGLMLLALPWTAPSRLWAEGDDPPARQPAMEEHPGRPLEPQQLQNLREGRPAGPMRDREFPAHPAPAQRAAPQERKSEKPAPKSSERGARPHGF